MLPFLLKDNIQNPINNDVWKLVREIVGYICAPKISSDQVAELNMIIHEYLLERTVLFPDDPIKPKHHYLLHYPKLILQLGPMIRLWTLIFESKHTFFKECSRKLKNFKHLTSTIANRHQLLQAYYHAGDLFPANIFPGIKQIFIHHIITLTSKDLWSI